MALLIRAGLALTCLTLGAGCSLVLDPDDLTAELRDGGDTVAGETDGSADIADDATAGDTSGAPDTAVHDTSDTTAPTDTTVVDTQNDTELPDTAAPPDTTVTDADTVDTAQDTAVVDTASDTFEGPNVVIAHSGALGCELDYKTQFLDLTACPRTCPDVGGWTLIFDATQSTGVTSYSWSFSVTNQYKITPTSSIDGRVELNLDVPSCDLFSGSSLGSARIYATLHVNGDGETEYPSQLDFSVRYLSNSCGSTQGNCPDP